MIDMLHQALKLLLLVNSLFYLSNDYSLRSVSIFNADLRYLFFMPKFVCNSPATSS